MNVKFFCIVIFIHFTYQQLADAEGIQTLSGRSGHVLKDNGNKLDAPIVKRSTSNLVDIARFEDSSPPGKQFSVYVDDTITRLVIQVKVDGNNPLMMLTKASGLPGPHETRNTSTGTVYHISTVDTPITVADYGIWKIMKMDGSKWHVLVQAESSVDFTHQFLENMGLFKLPIIGDPLQGKKYTISVEVQDYANIQKVDLMLIFILVKSSPANMIPAVDKGSGKYEVDMYMIDQEFMIGIQGKDNSGHFFRRISKLVKPVTLTLFIPPYTGVSLYENSTFDIEYSIVNKLTTDQDSDIRIEDTKHWALAPIFTRPTLKPGENYTGKFVIRAGLPGETTTVTVKARQYLGHGKFSPGPIEVRQFTVQGRSSTTVPTTSSPSSVNISNLTSLASMSASTSKSAMSSNSAPSSTSVSKLLRLSTHNTMSRLSPTLKSRTESTPGSSVSSASTSKPPSPLSQTSVSSSVAANQKSQTEAGLTSNAGISNILQALMSSGADKGPDAARRPSKLSTFKSPFNLIFNFNMC